MAILAKLEVYIQQQLVAKYKLQGPIYAESVVSHMKELYALEWTPSDATRNKNASTLCRRLCAITAACVEDHLQSYRARKVVQQGMRGHILHSYVSPLHQCDTAKRIV